MILKKEFYFTSQLKEGIILSRPNRFLMNVKINDDIVMCHCPSTGSIGSLKLDHIPCLVSESFNKNRKTKYTVEAISLDSMEINNKEWIGINQSKINYYIEFFLKSNMFHSMIPSVDFIVRESHFHNSRFDFKINDSIYLEVKMPLQTLLIDNINCVKMYNKKKPLSNFSSVERLVKHVNDLSLYSSTNQNHRTILLLCFLYSSQVFEVKDKSTKYNFVKETLESALSSGLEIWQANFNHTPYSISLKNIFEITDLFKTK